MKSFIKNLTFTKRQIPIPADYRPLFKIGHVILILAMASRSNKASLMKLHFLCWSIKSEQNISQVTTWMRNNFRSDYHIWGVEPTVNRAVTYAIAEGLLALNDGDYLLTDQGMNLYKLMKKDKELFQVEKSFLESIGKNGISEGTIKELSKKFI
ncbi:hypothetical protein ACS5PU_02590 [Pedobacter sp. GSP4]|uniref:hypothetical protein n=1 Tax=Pedobacter sp. GSP4 TaxID=3453716 RepID=UPI003EEF116B